MVRDSHGTSQVVETASTYDFFARSTSSRLLLKGRKNMASHETRCGHQVGRADRRATETHVRAGEAARLLRVVREISLARFVDIVINYLHGVLASTNDNISTHSIGLSMEHTSTA